MTENEKGIFLSEKVKELNRIISEIEAVFPEKSFKMDGILVGNIVEVLTAQTYGITLYKQSEKTHDGEVDGKKVQIKGTQGKEFIVIREEPEYLLVEYLDKETGTIQEVYNGPGAVAWQYRNYVPSMNHYTIRINKLLELNKIIADEERIISVIPIQKYEKTYIGEKEVIVKMKQTKKKVGKTLVKGYINRNSQENYGCLNKPGNHYNQMAYLLHCNICDFEYEANGCDVAIRKCPRCMQ